MPTLGRGSSARTSRQCGDPLGVGAQEARRSGKAASGRPKAAQQRGHRRPEVDRRPIRSRNGAARTVRPSTLWVAWAPTAASGKERWNRWTSRGSTASDQPAVRAQRLDHVRQELANSTSSPRPCSPNTSSDLPARSLSGVQRGRSISEVGGVGEMSGSSRAS